ncbi:MAG: phage portal protein [Verrucomicrobiae bacterium]|nr:phage portal protein [Verrucomicrobiae bacterium]
MDPQGIIYLRKKLEARRPRVLIRYKQYEMKYIDRSVGLTIPPELRQQFKSTLGWTAKAVDALADRLVFREFADDNFKFNDIFEMNNPDTLFDSAILSALIASCSFIYISPGGEPVPRLQVIDAANATGIIDPITGLLYEGYAVLSRDDKDRPLQEAYFYAGYTDYYTGGLFDRRILNKAPYPLLVPIIHRPDAVRPFGRSRISRSAMYWQRYAKNTLERAEITAEFYSFPQKYVVGLSQDAEPMETWKATISSMLQFTKDSDGGDPKLGQFTTPSMSPFTEQLKTAAAGFAGETGLTLDDLGFVTDNPSSAEAIKASHENLRVAARKAQRNFGSGFLNVGYLAACLRDDFEFKRSQFYLTKPQWEPVFEPDASTLSLVGDGAIKINQAVPGYFDKDTLRDLTGVKGADE